MNCGEVRRIIIKALFKINTSAYKKRTCLIETFLSEEQFLPDGIRDLATEQIDG